MENLCRIFLFYHTGTSRIYGFLHRYVCKSQRFPDEKVGCPPQIRHVRRCRRDGTITSVGFFPSGRGYLNLLKDDADHGVFDNSVGESSGYLEHQYEYIKRLSVKNLHWEDGRPYCYTIDGHEKTWFLNLHFVDITKIFMEGVYENQSYSAHAKFVTYMLKCRGRLADIKHGNTKWQQKLKIKRSKNV